ncbi:hypothetical protein LTR91_027202, partial [Friedmanniomyces endolithicus]
VAGDKNQTLPGEEEGLDPEVAKQYQRIKDDEDELLLDAIADFTELAGAARGRNVVDLEKFRELVQRLSIP